MISLKTLFGWFLISSGCLSSIMVYLLLRTGPVIHISFFLIQVIYRSIATICIAIIDLCYFQSLNNFKVFYQSDQKQWLYLSGCLSFLHQSLFLYSLLFVGFGDAMAFYVTAGIIITLILFFPGKHNLLSKYSRRSNTLRLRSFG
jgi:hypothetical protein